MIWVISRYGRKGAFLLRFIINNDAEIKARLAMVQGVVSVLHQAAFSASMPTECGAEGGPSTMRIGGVSGGAIRSYQKCTGDLALSKGMHLHHG
jgi:hypothetical protein